MGKRHVYILLYDVKKLKKGLPLSCITGALVSRAKMVFYHVLDQEKWKMCVKMKRDENIWFYLFVWILILLKVEKILIIAQTELIIVNLILICSKLSN